MWDILLGLAVAFTFYFLAAGSMKCKHGLSILLTDIHLTFMPITKCKQGSKRGFILVCKSCLKVLKCICHTDSVGRPRRVRPYG